LFEKAVATVGHFFNSQDLWNKYLEFEYSRGEYARVTKIYRRILKKPLGDLDKFWDAFQVHSLTRPFEELLNPEEDNLEMISKISTEEEKRKIVFSTCEETYKKTKTILEERKNFECSILRFYFHTQALDNGQLENWRDYLDFEEKENNHERILNLFERCLVPCALYFEFWKRFILYLEKNKLVDQVREVYEKITKIYLKRIPIAFIDFAEFEESQGNVKKAREIFKTLVSTCGKGHIESIVRFSYFEKRQKNLDESLNLFKNNLSFISSNDASFYHILHAQFALLCGKVNEARMIYKSYSENEKSSTFWISFCEFEIKQNSKSDEIIELFEKALKIVQEKKQILSRFSQYLMMIDSPKFREIEARLMLTKTFHPELLKPQFPESMISKKPNEGTMQWFYQQEKHFKP
jgi:pre-mRNA-processing factor 39